jgi:hypothetical protein
MLVAGKAVVALHVPGTNVKGVGLQVPVSPLCKMIAKKSALRDGRAVTPQAKSATVAKILKIENFILKRLDAN